jgi:hypothetical protein
MIQQEHHKILIVGGGPAGLAAAISAAEAGCDDILIIERDGEPGGMTIDDTVEFCKEIDGLVDIIHVSNGLKWAGSRTHTFSSFLDPHGINVEHAAKIKAAVKVSKVAVVGGFNSPEHCEEVLAAGKADFIELARQGFADPDVPNKALNGQEDSIRRCVRCFQCYPGFCEHPTDIPLFEKLGPEEAGKIYSPFTMGRCALNPNSGFGWYPETMFKDGIKKTIAWYFENEDWMKHVTSGDYQKYYNEMYK